MKISRLRFQLALFLFAPGVIASTEAQQQAPIQIHADLTDAPRKIYHADIDLPVHHGPLDLITPEWIPGAHGPTGPVLDISGIRFQADGKVLPWRRDPVNPYEYHVDIPAGASMLHAHLDCVVPRATRTAATLEWESLMLYPAHTPVREIAIQPTVTVPAKWGIGTSLKPLTAYDPQHPAGGTVKYAPTTVEMLEDSPIMTGLYFREYPLAPGTTPQHYMDLIGPTAASVEAQPAIVELMSRMVREGLAMYGPPHYTSYHFLIRLLRGNALGGLEHHESSDNTLSADFFTGGKVGFELAGVLPHEFAHSWNGKFRRPDGLATPDYATPMQNNLLWVYEGLTNYLGDIMTSRSGLTTPDQFRAGLALLAARMDAQSGRAWRSVEDTTFLSAMPRNGGSRGSAWASWKRSTDYYPEGTIFWLDVDTTIRKLTQDKKSLRDFLLIFLQKGAPGVPRVEPYTLAEVENDLNQVAPNDWSGFIKARLYDVQPRVNAEGMEQAGYRFEYTAEPSPELAEDLREDPSLGTWFSVGMDTAQDGTIGDVRVGSAADKAGFAPGQKIVSVNGRVFTPALFTEALKSAATPIQLMVQDEDSIGPVSLSYSEGPRYPRLTRIAGTRDRLAEILTPAAH